MSSADSTDNSDAGAPEDVEAKTEGAASDSVSLSKHDDAGTDSDNAAKRAARQAKKLESNETSVTISTRLLKQIGAGILVAAVIAVIAFGGWKLYDQKQELSAFDDSKTAGSEFVVTYLNSMGAQNATPDSLRKAVGPLTTGDLKKRLDAEAADSVKFMQDSKITNLTTTVTSSMVESYDADTSNVVVGVDVTGISPASGGPSKNALLLQLKVDKVDGDWLVSSINFGPGVTVGAQQGQQPTSAPTETPAPAPAPVPGG